MRKPLSLSIIAVLLMVIISCAGKGNPVEPINGSDSGSISQTSGNQTQTHLWGYYDVYIDIPSQTATAVLNRNAMFTANVVNFINAKPANLGFHINSTPVGTDYVAVAIAVSITHPFPGLPQYDGYDVRGVVMGDG
ncbi:MAG: hypothetical protein ABIC40_08235, partial [bacterium]